MTRILQGPPTPSVLAAPPKAAAPQGAPNAVRRKHKTNLVPLLVGLGILVAAAIVVVLIFALRK